MLAVGKVAQGNVELRVAPAAPVVDAADPYDVGWKDAELGKVCEPLTHYAKLGQIESYIIGFQECMFALQEAAEYADYMADVDFFRHGC
jgi:hypothetical protein